MRIRKIIPTNPGLLLLSLLLAVLLWLVVANIQDPVTTKEYKDVPVEVINENVLQNINKVYTVESGDTADFTVKGRRSVLDKLTEDNFEVTADLAHLSDVNAMMVDVTVKGATGTVEIYKNSNTMVVALENEVEESFPITVVTEGDLPNGYAIGSKTATPNIVEVKGPESLIKKIKTVQATIDVSQANTDKSVTSELKFYNGDGDELDSTSITADSSTIVASVAIYRTKDVNVTINTVGTLAVGYEVKEITYEPKTITVAGRDEDLEEMDSIEVDVDVDGLNANHEYTFDAADYLPDGIILANDDESIMVTASISKRITKTLTLKKNQINISGSDPAYDYKLANSTAINLTISGFEDDVDKLDASSFEPMVNVEGLTSGDYLLAVSLKNIDGVTVTESGKVSVNISKASD